MHTFPTQQSDYSYYPTTAIDLCVASYLPIAQITAAVEALGDLKVTWGPAEACSSWDVSYSLAFVAERVSTGERFVVIRGTNPYSLESWLKEDLDVIPPRQFNKISGCPSLVPDSIVISNATYNGMNDLLGLQAGNELLCEFLLKSPAAPTYVTGHSLGGTLTPAMFTYLNACMNGGAPATQMALWSFAGLTAGGTSFNDYFNTILPNDQGFEWRIQNSLDIAPLLWGDGAKMKSLYDGYGLSYGFPESWFIDSHLKDAEQSGVGFAQPQPGLVLPGTYDINETTWATQALQQHHSTTYQQMVHSHFASDSEAKLAREGSAEY